MPLILKVRRVVDEIEYMKLAQILIGAIPSLGE